MARRGFTIIAIASGVLCFVTAGIWIRSYFVRDEFRQQTTGFDSDGSPTILRRSLLADGGHLVWTTDHVPMTNPQASPWTWVTDSPRRKPGPPSQWLNHLGFINRQHWKGSSPFQWEYEFTWVPCWLITILTAAAPLIRFTPWRYHRHPAGHCRTCGYDLRATPDRCPECGVSP